MPWPANAAWNPSTPSPIPPGMKAGCSSRGSLTAGKPSKESKAHMWRGTLCSWICVWANHMVVPLSEPNST